MVFATTLIPVRGEGLVPVSLIDCHFHFVPLVSCSMYNTTRKFKFTIRKMTERVYVLSGNKRNASL